MRSFSLLLSVILVAGFKGTLDGQLVPPYWRLRLAGPAVVVPYQELRLEVYMDSLEGGPLLGLSYGVCQEVIQAYQADDTGGVLMTVNLGAPAEFSSVAVLPDGVTHGVIICLSACALLPAEDNQKLLTIDYFVPDVGPVEVRADFCESLGDPPVNVVVSSTGNAISPEEIPYENTILDLPPPFRFVGGSFFLNYTAQGNPGETQVIEGLVVPFDIQTNPEFVAGAGGAATPPQTEGFAMAVETDPDRLVPQDYRFVGPIEALGSVDFAEFSLWDSGFTLGAVYSFTGQSSIVFPSTDEADLEVIYNAEVPLDATSPVPTSVSFSNNLGQPPVTNTVVVGVETASVDLVSGVIVFQPIQSNSYVRSDCNDDGVINIADAVNLLQATFNPGGPEVIRCDEACNFDRDSQITILDATLIIEYQLLDGPPPSDPFPNCGFTLDDLGCLEFKSCP